MTTTLTAVPIDSIQRGDNDRQSFDQVALEELSESIRAHGLVQPITIRPISSWLEMERGHQIQYQIVAGERRWRACKLLAWTEIPAIVRTLDDEAASAIMLAENIGRKDLTPIEEANAYRRRIDQFGWSETQVADVAGVSPDLVRRRLSLLCLVPEAQSLVGSGQLPVGHGQALTCLDNNRQRIALRVYSHSAGMTLRAFRPVVGDLLQEQSQAALFDLQQFWVHRVEEEACFELRGGRAAALIRRMEMEQDALPVRHKNEDTAGEIMAGYIVDLEQAGQKRAAAALCHLYRVLVSCCCVQLPRALVEREVIAHVTRP